MADEASDLNGTNEPPLVLRVGLPAPPRPPKPRPGLGEAILWCIVFLFTQLLSTIVTFALVLLLFALTAPSMKEFFQEQFGGFGKAVDVKTPARERPAMPGAIGQALAYGMLAAQFASLGLILLVMPRRVGPDWCRQIGVRTPAGLHVLLIFLVVPGFLIVPDAMLELTRGITGLQPSDTASSLKSVFRDVPMLVSLLAVSIGPGVVEELWCRGFLGRGLTARYGMKAGVLLTSLLFGLLHVEPALVPTITLMGIYLHFVYLMSRSIWISILLHVLNNGVTLLRTLLVSGPEQADPAAAELKPVVYLAAFAVILFGSIAFWTSRAEVVRAGKEGPEWQPEYPGISTPPAGLGGRYRLIHAAVSPASVVMTFVSCCALLYLLTR
jgi:membrane protease YdiL (CAAX protease family)